MTKFSPIPNMSLLRAGKLGYDSRYEIDTTHPLHDDPLVDPREQEFGFFDATSYYSKPNAMTGEKLPGVPDAPLVRLDVARRLVRANTLLSTDSDVRDYLGAAARLKIEDALRSYDTQVFAYEVAWPAVIRKINPGITDEELRLELPKYVAKPNTNITPTPHLTGGAVDVALINMQTGEKFDRGHKGGAIKGTAYPDFHEGYHLSPGESDIENVEGQANVADEQSEIVKSRRVLYWAMTSAGLSVNPHEIWHYGIGDPLSAYVSGAGKPYYGIVSLPEGYLQRTS